MRKQEVTLFLLFLSLSLPLSHTHAYFPSSRLMKVCSIYQYCYYFIIIIIIIIIVIIIILITIVRQRGCDCGEMACSDDGSECVRVTEKEWTVRLSRCLCVKV